MWLKEDGQYYWYQNDHLGTPQKLIDINGTVVWAAQYTAFGEAQIQTETVTNNLRFPGQYYDAETGLHYNYHRYYDPDTGRYWRTDPLRFDGGDVNWYAYVGMNPVNGYDPEGLLFTEGVLTAAYAANPPACLALLGAGAILAGGYAACVAEGICQAPTVELPDVSIPPLVIGEKPVVIGGYPPIRGRSPFFPNDSLLPVDTVCSVIDPGATERDRNRKKREKEKTDPKLRKGKDKNKGPKIPRDDVCGNLLQTIRDAKEGKVSQFTGALALAAWMAIGCEEPF